MHAAPIAGEVGITAIHGIKDNRCRCGATERRVGLCLELVGEHGKSTLAVERARRARPSSDENGISSWRSFAVGASSAEAAENWIVVSSSARAKRVPSCMVGSESLLHRNNLTGIYVMSAMAPSGPIPWDRSGQL